MTDTIFPTTLESKSTSPTPPWATDSSLEALVEWGPWVTDALIALMAKVGVDSSGVATSLDGRAAALEADVPSAVGVWVNVVLDHADTSPVTLLASSAAAREVLIVAIATEAAADTPDIDIGETDDTDKFLVDIAAGAWTVGQSFAAYGTLTAGKALLATIATAGSAGAFRVLVIELPDRTA